MSFRERHLGRFEHLVLFYILKSKEERITHNLKRRICNIDRPSETTIQISSYAHDSLIPPYMLLIDWWFGSDPPLFRQIYTYTRHTLSDEKRNKAKLLGGILLSATNVPPSSSTPNKTQVVFLSDTTVLINVFQSTLYVLTSIS